MKNENVRRLARAIVGCALSLPMPLLAGDRTVGDWAWNTDDPAMFYAGTGNDAGHMLVQFCDPEDGSCFYAVGLDILCDAGDPYPVLANSDAGAVQLAMMCGDRVADQNVLVAIDFEAMDDLVRSARRVGFAVPMHGDEFKSVRFSLHGSNEALDAMRAELRRAAELPSGRRDTPEQEIL